MRRNTSHNHYQAKDESCLCLKRFRLCSNLSCMTELSWISRGFCILPFVTKMHAVSDQMHATRPFESHLRLQQQVVANVTLLQQIWSHERHLTAPLALAERVTQKKEEALIVAAHHSQNLELIRNHRITFFDSNSSCDADGCSNMQIWHGTHTHTYGCSKKTEKQNWNALDFSDFWMKIQNRIG